MQGFGEKQEACSVLAADRDACIDSRVKAEEGTHASCTSVSSDTVSHMHPFFPCSPEAASLFLVPAEVDLTWAIGTFLYQWLMELTSRTRVDVCPTELTVILQASDVGTKKGGEFSTTACALALITHLVIQHIWLHLHLDKREKVSHSVGSRGHRVFQRPGAAPNAGKADSFPGQPLYHSGQKIKSFCSRTSFNYVSCP